MKFYANCKIPLAFKKYIRGALILRNIFKG